MKKLKTIGSLFVEAGKKWSEDRAARLAAALAYYTLFSLAPLLVILAGIGNYLRSEILWSARLDPRAKPAMRKGLSERRR